VGSFVFLYLIPASVDIDTWNLELPVAGLRIPVTAFTVGVLASWAFVFMVKFLPSFVGYCLLGLNIFVVLRILGLNFVDGVDGVDGVDTLFNTHISVGLSIAAVFGTVLAIEPVVGLLGVPGRYAYFTRPDLVRR
jgi:hypothetical protein